MIDFLHKANAVLLSGAVLLSSVLPPAVCHAHVGGDQKHSHHSAERDHRANGHREGGHHHDLAPEGDHSHHCDGELGHHGHGDEHGIEHPTTHLHASIAGFDFTLPLPGDGNPHGQYPPVSDNGDIVGVVRLTDDFTVGWQSDLASMVKLSVVDVLTIDVAADKDDARARWLHGRADRTFLCDIARCERSGVLLI